VDASTSTDVRPWQLVTSVAGRDEGHAYLVFRILDDGFADLVDGDKRKVDAPKRKNVRHLVSYPHIAGDLAERDGSGSGVKNADVRAALDQLTIVAGLRGSQTGTGQDSLDR